MTEETGLTSAVAMTPNSMAHSVGAVRNSQAEIPAARATISSEERVSRQKHRMPPSSTANGRICMATYGRRSAAIWPTVPKLTSGWLAERRSSSMKSNIATRPDSASSMPLAASANWRTI